MIFDARTGFLFIGALSLVISLALWAVLFRQRTRALHLWCGGGLAAAAASLLLALREVVPDVLGYTTASLCVFLMLVLKLQAIRLELDEPDSVPRLAILVLIFLAGYEVLRLGANEPLRYFVFMVVVMVMNARIAWGAWRLGRRQGHRSADWIAGAFALMAAMYSFRLINAGLGVFEAQLMTQGYDALLLALASLIGIIVSNLAWLGLAFERLIHAQVAQLERQRILGLLSASLGHELNQPLTAVLANAQVVRRGLRSGRLDPARSLDFLDRIIFNTQRASQIIEKIRGLIPPAQARHEPVDLARLIQEVGELVATEIRPRKAVFDFHLPERPLWVMGDPIQLTRMVLNLLRNAIDAPSHGQRCDIEVCLRELEGGALLQVQDRRPRLGPEVLRQAGRPFLAVKTLELGRGLDHSISCAIAERHGGNLTLTNAQGGGVLAELRLPLRTVAPPDLHLAVQDRPARRPMTVSDRRLADRCARGHVVVIDHDVEILAALRAIFELEGYACETYDSAVAYLQVLNDNRPCFPGPCCLLCDVRLPELDGLELQRRLAELKAIPMLLMGSASGAPEAVSAFRAGALDVLIKPVDAETLLDAVARALAVSAERQRQGARRCELAARLSTLTNREREVARRVALGQRNLAIAEELGIALRTVKRHRQQVMEKLEADTLVDLVRVIDEAGGTRSPIR